MIQFTHEIEAPFKDVREASMRGTLGHLNPTPWAVMTGNCIGWLTYSYLINNLFLFFANAPGLILSVWLNMAAAKLQYSDRISKGMRASFVELLDRNRQSFRMPRGRRLNSGDLNRDDILDNEDNDDNGTEIDSRDAAINNATRNSINEASEHDANDSNNDIHSFANLKQMALDITIQKAEAPAPHEKIVVGVVTFWVSVISLLYFLQLNISQWKYVVGIIANINTCMFYGAPLSTIYTVIKQRDSSSIHRPTMIMNTSNAIFWAAFGFGVRDWIIVVPGSIGAMLGFIQIFLRLVVPSSSTFATSSNAIETTADESTTTDEFIESRKCIQSE